MLVARPAGGLADRVGRRRLVAGAGLAAAGGTALLLLAPSTTMALVAGGILGVSVGVFLTARRALATQIVPGVEGGGWGDKKRCARGKNQPRVPRCKRVGARFPPLGNKLAAVRLHDWAAWMEA